MGDVITYPWQQTVLEVYRISPEFLPAKIKIAQNAIAARLNDQRPPDAFEKVALKDALNALRVLAEATKPKGADQKKNIA